MLSFFKWKLKENIWLLVNQILWRSHSVYSSKKNRLFISLSQGSALGGPERFLRQLTDVLTEQKKIQIESQFPCKSSAALFFSVSPSPKIYKLCQRAGTRTVLRVDGFYVPQEREINHGRSLSSREKLINDRMRLDILRADHVIYQSWFSKVWADKILCPRVQDFSVIPNGVDTKYFFSTERLQKKEKPCIVMLGKHYHYQVKYALRVFKAIKISHDVKLKIIGPARDTDFSFQKVIHDELGISVNLGDVEIEGKVNYEDLPAKLRDADVFLQMKVGDWCPNAVIEGLACGLPIVSPAFGGTQELVGDAGIVISGPEWVVNDDMCEDMAKAIVVILDALPEYSQKARLRALEHFDRRSVAERYLKTMGC